jgi:two-component system sensor histidine kinase KdpD
MNILPLPTDLADRWQASRLTAYAWTLMSCTLVTLLAYALRSWLGPENLVLLYLMQVVLVAVRLGRGAGIAASLLAVIAFDFFIVPPYYSLSVADSQYLLTFAVMLVVALIISGLMTNLRTQASLAAYRERRATALFELSKALSAALTSEQVIEIGRSHLHAMFHAPALLLAAVDGRLRPPAKDAQPRQAMLAAAQDLLDSDADQRTAGGALYLPLRAPMRVRGVLVLPQAPDWPLQPEMLQLLQTCAAQIALALERVHYVDVAQAAQLEMESERLRNSLLSAMSHDVRTPLTAIVGLSGTLAGSGVLSSAVRQELAEAIQEEALRMEQLVANLLDMARLQAGPAQQNRQWQMLEEVKRSALRLLARTLAGRRIDMRLAPALPPLEFDAVLIERVFCNLLSNAARHTPPGSPLSIAASRHGDLVEIAVEDQGPGVAPADRERIFDKFSRTQSETAGSGVGLGLSICRTIVEAHGGRIRVEAGAAGGARFIFTLPVGSLPPEDAFLDDAQDALGTQDAQA